MTRPRCIIILIVLGGLLIACSREPAFRGTALDPPRKTLDFALRDQFGKQVRLSDLRGRVVVLTFLYTSCPDVCPLVTAKLRTVAELLASQASGVVFLAVTVDPERDTVERLYTYSQQQGMLDRWRFLRGDVQELQPVWDYYWVGNVRKERVGQAADAPQQAGAAPPPAPHTVQHTAPVHLIDQQGQVRVAYGSTLRPAELAHDIEILLKRGGA